MGRRARSPAPHKTSAILYLILIGFKTKAEGLCGQGKGFCASALEKKAFVEERHLSRHSLAEAGVYPPSVWRAEQTTNHRNSNPSLPSPLSQFWIFCSQSSLCIFSLPYITQTSQPFRYQGKPSRQTDFPPANTSVRY